jgi:hypothetical protein
MAKRVRDLRLIPASVRRYVEDRFSLNRMVGEYVALYNEIEKREKAA